jgi:hypothetical protein
MHEGGMVCRDYSASAMGVIEASLLFGDPFLDEVELRRLLLLRMACCCRLAFSAAIAIKRIFSACSKARRRASSTGSGPWWCGVLLLLLETLRASKSDSNVSVKKRSSSLM